MWLAILIGWLLLLGVTLLFFAGAHRCEHMHRCHFCHKWYAGEYKAHAHRMHGRVA